MEPMKGNRYKNAKGNIVGRAVREKTIGRKEGIEKDLVVRKDLG